ncbi:sterol desaturase family protein [Chloroflexi bacterium TSY]|nr:sterol desaturase family protein [Chloroflexi bacterium TSY]
MDDTLFGTRNRRGDWQPFGSIAASPRYLIPPQPVKLLKWIFGWHGYIFPWPFLWTLITLACWFWLTPSFEQMRNLEIGWLSFIFVRNAVIVFIYAGLFHLHFYMKRTQGNQFKYNARFLETDNPKFLFRHQTKDNLVWVFLSGVPIWTAYEGLTLWAYANGWIPMISWAQYPIYCTVFFFLIPIIRDIHFYLVHRLLHWPPLYRIAHEVHHRNINPGPWSGLSMHPVEHLFYFTGILIHWVIPSHPVIAMWHIFHAGLSPHAGHAGFEKMVLKDGVSVDTGTYYHYLHHKYFECNYSGDGASFLDKFFGTFHDGTEESTESLKQRLRNRAPA